MELNDAIALLTTYNRWRRGEDETLDMPNPREIGIALDTVLAAVIEGGTGNSGVERPEPSPHFQRERDEARQQEQIHYDNFLSMQKERDEALAAATWSVQWLDTVIDRLQHEATIKELFEDMAKVRETNSVLDGEWNRCGWTGTQAARFLKNWRKEEA